MENGHNQDGSLKVYFDSAKMAAFLEVQPPVGQGRPCTYEQAVQTLTEHGIVHGINDARIKELIAKGREKAVVAQGTMPVDGEAAKLDFFFPLPSHKLAPTIDEKGIADYHNLGLINNIRRGELLVLKTPATPGTPGYNVLGEEIPPKPGRDIALPRGKNTVANPEETQLYAAVDGHVSLVGGKVVVSPVYNLDGDVDFSSGDIDFVGNVLINGNVASGFKVKAGGDIEIRGFIENAEVIAEGSIQVIGGITGGLKGLVKAGEDLQARFVENSRIEAGKNIFVREAIMQSQVKAGGNIKVMDKKGIIVGGTIQASGEVECKILGSQLATQTTVEVGVNPYYREEYHRLGKAHGEVKKNVDNLGHNINVFQRSGMSMDDLDDKKRQLLMRILDEFKKQRSELQRIEERMVYLEQEFEKSSNARISAWEVVYPGVRLSIGQCVHVVNDPIKYSAFVLDKGEIKVASLR